jgi:hypothetical protein
MKALVCGLALALGFTSTAAATDCSESAVKALEQQGITDWKIDHHQTVVMTQDVTMGYRVWFRVARCEKGYVVVNTQTSCTVTDIWVQGDCDVEIHNALGQQ